MPSSFAEIQSKLLSSNWLDSNADEKGLYIVIEGTLTEYYEKFIKNLEKYYNERGLAGSGNLISKAEVEISEANGNQVMKILLPYYYDFVNKGVKGVRSSRNAPKSPYKFKTLGMSEEGYQSIKRYIQSGRSKSRNVKRTVGMEGKYKKISGKGKLDQQVKEAIIGIKSYGIKTTNYFDDAYKDTFGDLQDVISERIGGMVAISIQKSFK